MSAAEGDYLSRLYTSLVFLILNGTAKTTSEMWHSYNILWKILLKLVYFTFPFTVFLNFQVLYQWNNKNLVTVRNLMTEMVAWQRNIYLDPGIWEYFQSRMNPAVLPDDISALQLPDLLAKVQFSHTW